MPLYPLIADSPLQRCNYTFEYVFYCHRQGVFFHLCMFRSAPPSSTKLVNQLPGGDIDPFVPVRLMNGQLHEYLFWKLTLEYAPMCLQRRVVLIIVASAAKNDVAAPR